jgi:outer membrane protein assembly factor BamB
LVQRWFSQINTGEVYSSPTIGSDGTIYIGSFDNNIYAFPASPLWTYTCSSSIYTTPAIDNLGNLYAFQTVNSNVSTAGELLWIFTPNLSPTPVSSFGSPTCGTDGTVFYTVYQDNRTLLFAVSSKGINGNPYTPYVIIPNATLSQCSPFVGADGTIYIIDTNSIIYAFTYNSGTGIFTLLFTYNIVGNQVYGTMSLSMDANGVLYIGGANRQMVALKPN